MDEVFVKDDFSAVLYTAVNSRAGIQFVLTHAEYFGNFANGEWFSNVFHHETFLIPRT